MTAVNDINSRERDVNTLYTSIFQTVVRGTSEDGKLASKYFLYCLLFLGGSGSSSDLSMIDNVFFIVHFLIVHVIEWKRSINALTGCEQTL